MVAAVHVGEDGGPGDAVPQPVGHQEIVDAPPGVVLPGVEAVAPPGIGPRSVRVQPAEGVGKPGGEQLGHLGALLVGEAGVAPVGLGVFQVDLLVGHIHVPADHHRLSAVQTLEIGPEGVLPRHAVGQTGQSILGVGGIDGDQIELRVLQGDAPALPHVVGIPDVVGHTQGLPPGENGGAGVALLLRRVPVLKVAGGVDVGLTGLHLGLLQAQRVAVRGGEKVEKSLFDAGPQAVDVPGIKTENRRMERLLSKKS